MINNLQNLHKSNYIHRDIKPENLVIGNEGHQHIIYLIDFGLSKKYIENNKHIPFLENKGLIGTARYTSINSHIGTEQSRRDDLESLGYIILYFVNGTLPWQNYQCESKNEKFRKILETKVSTSLDVLCQSLPQEFKDFFSYTKQLEFEEEPNYEYLKQLFINCSKRFNSQHNKICFDWCLLKCQQEYHPFFYHVCDNQTDYKNEEIEEKNCNENQIKIPKFNISHTYSLYSMNQKLLLQSSTHRSKHTSFVETQKQFKSQGYKHKRNYTQQIGNHDSQYVEYDVNDNIQNVQINSKNSNISIGGDDNQIQTILYSNPVKFNIFDYPTIPTTQR